MWRPQVAFTVFVALLGLAWVTTPAAWAQSREPAQSTSAATTAAAPAPRFVREPNLDRSGNDIRSEKLAPTAGVEDCEQRCADTKGCVAYTFVKRSTTVPAPICWLKDTVPAGYDSSCCTSGVLHGVDRRAKR